MKSNLNGDLVAKITIILAFLVSGANLIYGIVKGAELSNSIVLFGFMVVWTGWYFWREKKRKNKPEK